jgi:exonuclease SbcD
MRILHTSDWHIGRQFHQVSLLEDQRYVLQQIIALAEKKEVDVVVIAGDLYDRAVPPASAVSLVDEVLSALCNRLKIPVILISGNHDSPERLNFGSDQLAKANLYMLGKLAQENEPIYLRDKHGEVAFYGLPYADPLMVRDTFEDAQQVKSHDEAMCFLVGRIQQESQQRSVLISHCFVGGAEPCDSERPLSIGGADQVSSAHFDGFDYVALGHLHGPQQRSKPSIRYSGSILKYSFSEEKHTKSVTLVAMGATGQCEIEQINLQAMRNMRTLEGELDSLIAMGKTDPNADDYLLVRLIDTNALLEPMQKLRTVYPNVMHLERPGLLAGNQKVAAVRDKMLKGEWAMFNDFYQQVQGEALTTKQADVMKSVLAQCQQGEQ